MTVIRFTVSSWWGTIFSRGTVLGNKIADVGMFFVANIEDYDDGNGKESDSENGEDESDFGLDVHLGAMRRNGSLRRDL